MIELFIEGQRVDINDGFSTLMTYSIDDVKDFGAKNTAFSKTIILPGTKVNNTLFGNIFSVTRSTQYVAASPNFGKNFNAAASAKALVFADNVQIFKGVMRLLEIVIDGAFIEYEVAVFGDLGGFIAKVGNQRLEDLDFSTYDHTYSIFNIEASWANANAGEDYYYPLIDYGTVSTGAFGTAKKDYQYQSFRPALHVREYLDKIVTGAGYTWESVFFDTDFFKRLIIPNNAKQLTRTSSTGLDVGYLDTGQLFQDPTGYYEIEHPSQTVLGDFTTADDKRFGYTGAPTIAGKFTLRIKGTYDYFQTVDPNLRLTLFTDTAGGTADYYFAPATSGSVAFDITLEVTATFNTGNFVFASLVASTDFGDSWYVNVTETSLVFTLSSLTPIPINLGEAITINDSIPRGIFQKDFFSSILKMFSLLVSEDKDRERHLIIEPYTDFYNTDPTTFEDWTDKIDRSEPLRIKPMSELNARYYELKFKSDSDFFNDDYRKKYTEGYGDRIYDNGFEFAKEKEEVEVIFAASVLTGYLGEDKIVPAIFKKTNNLEDRTDHVIRIMQAKKVTGVTSWDIMNGATVLSSNTDYPYAGHLDDPDVPTIDLNFGVPKELQFILVSGNISANLFNIFYSAYFADVTDVDSKLLTAKIRLTRKDIHDLDFSKFVYVDGSLFRKNKIIDYNATEEDTCTIELLKTINTIY